MKKEKKSPPITQREYDRLLHEINQFKAQALLNNKYIADLKNPFLYSHGQVIKGVGKIVGAFSNYSIDWAKRSNQYTLKADDREFVVHEFNLPTIPVKKKK